MCKRCFPDHFTLSLFMTLLFYLPQYQWYLVQPCRIINTLSHYLKGPMLSKKTISKTIRFHIYIYYGTSSNLWRCSVTILCMYILSVLVLFSTTSLLCNPILLIKSSRFTHLHLMCFSLSIAGCGEIPKLYG